MSVSRVSVLIGRADCCELFDWLNSDSMGFDWLSTEGVGFDWLSTEDMGFDWLNSDAMGFDWPCRLLCRF